MSPSTLTDKRRMKETRPKFYVTAQWRDHLNWAEPSWSHQCFLRPWLLVQPGSDPATSLSAYRCSPNWANRTAWSRRASAFIFFAMESATLSASLQLDRRLQSESVVSDGTRSPKTNIPICLSLFDSISMLKWRELHVCDLTVLTDCRTNLFLDHIPWSYEWNQSFKVWLAAAREFSEFCFLLDG